jgi:hypothetical protein
VIGQQHEIVDGRNKSCGNAGSASIVESHLHDALLDGVAQCRVRLP